MISGDTRLGLCPSKTAAVAASRNVLITGSPYWPGEVTSSVTLSFPSRAQSLVDERCQFLCRLYMPCPYPARSPASMPGARTMRLARRLAGGMTPAEVAGKRGHERGQDTVISR